MPIKMEEAADALHSVRSSGGASISVMDLSLQVAEACRQWLAGVLRGEPPRIDAPGPGHGALVRTAEEEGVLTLVVDRLTGWTGDPALRDAFSRAARGPAATWLLRHAECQRVLAVLAQADTPLLLLKGSALAWWLYPSPFLRECSDIDLLLPSRAAVRDAAQRLAACGYSQGYDQGADAYELVCRRSLSGSMRLDLDLHWGLNNAPVFAHVLRFDELLAESIALPGLAPNARGLSPCHALLHACMHRGINLYTGVGDSLKWLYDLHLMAQRLTSSDWERVVGLCRERHLASVCLSGLDAAAARFGEAVPAGVMTALRAIPLGTGVEGRRLQSWYYMHWMNLKALPGHRSRASWLLRKLLPTVPHMREMYGHEKDLAGLLVARVRQLARKAR